MEPATSDFMVHWTGSFLQRDSNHLHKYRALQAKRPYAKYRKFATVFYLHDKQISGRRGIYIKDKEMLM